MDMRITRFLTKLCGFRVATKDESEWLAIGLLEKGRLQAARLKAAL